MYQDGQDYSAPPENTDRTMESKRLSDKLKSKVVSQIKRCAHSIIIIDDIQKMMHEVLVALGSLLEGDFEHEGIRYSTRDIIFIFTSDLGREDLTRNLSLPELRALIHEKTMEFIVDEKVANLLYTVPFRSLGKDAISSIITKYLLSAHCRYPEVDFISFDALIVNYLADYWYRYDVLRKKNGRGIYNEIIQTLVTPLIDDALEKLPHDKKYHMTLHLVNDTLSIVSKIKQQ